MKVVLFCGGLGTRLKEHAETIPKPMVHIGYRPIIWHVMRYYAHYGHKDFILCLGFRGDALKEYFLNYNECISNDFVMKNAGRDVVLANQDISDWTISFVDTGLNSNIGERLTAVRDLVAGDEMFLANYSDGLANVDLSGQLAHFEGSGAVASMALVRPANQSFHFAMLGQGDCIEEIRTLSETDMWVNGGFFILRPGIFDYMKPGEELVQEPFRRLVDKRKIVGYRHSGFWCAMDTLKDKTQLDTMWARGDRPWQVWTPAPLPRT